MSGQRNDWRAWVLAGGAVLFAASWLVGRGWGQEAAPAEAPRAKAKTKAQTKSKPGPRINDEFKDPDVNSFIKRFESDTREVYAQRRAITAALELKPGMAVADVGAGTGFFTRLFARAVGRKGKVYAVDVTPKFLEHIADDAKKQGLTQVATVQATQGSTELPRGSVDVVFMSDVYHHLEKPQKTLASIRQALRPGGRFVLVELDRRPGKSSAFVLKHVRAGKDVFRKEIEAAGFTLVPTPGAPALKENFLMRFEKKHKAPGREAPLKTRKSGAEGQKPAD